MTKFLEYDYTIPAHMVCAIEYGDYDGLSKSEERALDEFIDSLPKGNRVLSFELFSQLAEANDVLGNLPCDCIQATLTVIEE